MRMDRRPLSRTSSLKGAVPQGERRVMDCIDCHNRAAHTMQTAEDALNRAMAEGAISPELPWVHKKGLELLKANYATEAEAREKIPARAHAVLSQRASRCAGRASRPGESCRRRPGHRLHNQRFPDMKVTWGTHPNHIGHMSYPGCFRCHDGDHVAKDGKTAHAGLRRMPQPARSRRSQAQGSRGSRHSIRKLCTVHWGRGGFGAAPWCVCALVICA